MNNPKLIPAPFAINGQKNSIPDRFSSEMPSNTATWDQGFPPITTIPATAGGLPPIGQDFNGIFNQVSENIVFLAEGGRYKFSEEHAVSIGGYKQGAVLQSDDNLSEYQSLIDGNMVNFNTAPEIEVSAAWKKIFPIALSSAIDSTSETTAATSKAVKSVYDLANAKLGKTANLSDLESVSSAIENLGLAEILLGYKQTWNSVTSDRQTGVTYTNTTGNQIMVAASMIVNSTATQATLYIDGVAISSCAATGLAAGGAVRSQLTGIIPNNSTYQISAGSILQWSELR